ncbi:MAG TPA: histidinol-phosphate transaminase [Methanomicrobia archaeon]|nr:histidinol-phosphate transaminase [Methanomicrobia archaeon]HEX58747.1 histidinol-phosphate transaminase [Methanomicrobia archaeon]
MKKVKVRAALKDISEYKPGRWVEGAIKLSSNENPLGPSPKAVEAVIRCAKLISRYPEAHSSLDGCGCEHELIQELSKWLGVAPENIVLGAGVDGVLDTLVKLFVESGDEAIIPIPTFSLYETLVRLCGGVPRFLQRDERRNFEVAAADIVANASEKTKLVFLGSPNNPTGDVIAEAELRAILETLPSSMIVVDEAYVEFAERSFVPLVREYENLVVTRTFSKAFGLAGLRVGYAVMDEDIAKEYKKAAIPFSVNILGIAAALAALQDEEHLRRTVSLVKTERAFFIKNIPFRTFPSHANFVLVDVSPFTSKQAFEFLVRRGVVVRDCSSFRGAGTSFIRISIGTHEQNLKVIDALSSLVGSLRRA